MDTPVFLLNAESFDFNFCQYAGNGHYYWITDITSERNDLWSVACAVDVLATFKDEIQATTAWVAYSAQNYNMAIIDDRLPTVLTMSSQYASATPTSFNENGFYVLIVAGQGSSGNTGGFSKVYGMSASNLRAMADEFYTLGEQLDNLKTYFLSPYDSIVDIFWVPLTLSGYGGGDDSVILGNIALGVNGDVIVQRNHEETVSLTIYHPYGDFRDATDCDYTLYLPFYGYMEIPAADLYGFTTLTVEIVTDLFAAGVVYRIYATNTAGAQSFIGTYGASVRGTIPVGRSQSFSLSQITNPQTIGVLAKMASMLYTRFTEGGNLVSMAEGVYSRQPKASGDFSSTAMAKLPLNVELGVVYRNRSEAPSAQNAVRGNACGKTLSLGSLSGYVQTVGASVSINGELDHARRINAYLDGGVYLE